MIPLAFPTALAPTRIWFRSTLITLAVVLVVGLFGLVAYKSHELGQLQVELERERDRAEAALALARAQDKVRVIEVQLAADVAQLRKQTDEELQDLAAHRDTLLRRLRSVERARAAQGAGVSGTPSAAADGSAAGVGDSAQLPGSLGEPDVDEAFRADTIRLELLACYQQYQRAADAQRSVRKSP